SAVDYTSNAMFVRTPFGEPGQPLHDAIGIGMENVGAIPVHEHPVAINLVERIPCDMGPPVNDVDLISRVGELAGNHTAGKASPHDKDHSWLGWPWHVANQASGW